MRTTGCEFSNWFTQHYCLIGELRQSSYGPILLHSFYWPMWKDSILLANKKQRVSVWIECLLHDYENVELYLQNGYTFWKYTTCNKSIWLSPMPNKLGRPKTCSVQYMHTAWLRWRKGRCYKKNQLSQHRNNRACLSSLAIAACGKSSRCGGGAPWHPLPPSLPPSVQHHLCANDKVRPGSLRRRYALVTLSLWTNLSYKI